jgi:hypothetical protein
LISAEKIAAAITRFGEDYRQMIFERFKKGTGIERAVSEVAPTFYDVTNFFGEDATLFWLRFHIAETFAFLGIYDTVSKFQVQQTADLIISHEIYGQLTLSEFLCFLTRFKRGDYGKIYQSARPNPQEFLSCLRPFWNELVEHRIKIVKAEQAKREAEQAKKDKENAMTREEWIEIKTITAMYNSDYTVP